MMVELFSGVLSGAAIGPDVGSMYKNLDRKQDVGHFFCLFDVKAFLDYAEYLGRIDETIDRIKASKKRPGVEEILVPGERSARKASHQQRAGHSRFARDACGDRTVVWPLETLHSTAMRWFADAMPDILISENVQGAAVDALRSRFRCRCLSRICGRIRRCLPKK